MSVYDMTSWRLVETSDGTLHVVGWSETTQEGRVSSAIVRIEATTRSGGLYCLLGQSGRDPDAEYVLKVWLETNSLSVVKDQT